MKNKKLIYLATTINIIISIIIIWCLAYEIYRVLSLDIRSIQIGISILNLEKIKEMIGTLFLSQSSFLTSILFIFLLAINIISWSKILKEKENGLKPLAFVLNSFVLIIILSLIGLIYTGFQFNNLKEIQNLFISIFILIVLLSTINFFSWRKYKKQNYKFGVIFSSIISSLSLLVGYILLIFWGS